MNLAFMHMPMVLFTTLVPMASGAFVGLAIAFLTTRFSDERLARIDRWDAASAGHPCRGLRGGACVLRSAGARCGRLAKRVAWVNAARFAGEPAVRAGCGGVLGGCDDGGPDMPGGGSVFSSVLAVGALALSFFIGAAYWGSAVSSWASPVAAVGVAGFCAAGGVPLGVLVVALGGGMAEAQDARFSSASMFAAFVGVVAAIFAVASQMLYAQSVVSAFFPGAEALPGSWVYLAISIAGFVVMLVCLRTALSPDRAAAFGRTAGAAAAVPMRDRAAVRPENAARSAVVAFGGRQRGCVGRHLRGTPCVLRAAGVRLRPALGGRSARSLLALARTPPEAVRQGAARKLVANRALWHARGRLSALRASRARRNPRLRKSRGLPTRRIGPPECHRARFATNLRTRPPRSRASLLNRYWHEPAFAKSRARTSPVGRLEGFSPPDGRGFAWRTGLAYVDPGSTERLRPSGQNGP